MKKLSSVIGEIVASQELLQQAIDRLTRLTVDQGPLGLDESTIESIEDALISLADWLAEHNCDLIQDYLFITQGPQQNISFGNNNRGEGR